MIVTSKQMKTIEHNALAYHMSFVQMMENAGGAAADVIRRSVEIDGCYVTIFCGCGNNGGDGFVTARLLDEAGADVAVILTDGMPRTEQAQTMIKLLGGTGVTIIEYGVDPIYLTERLAATELLVDAIYGAGFHGELDERHRDICRLINGVEVQTAALDLPSGVTADTGAADEFAVRADLTVVFDSNKPATALPAAAKYCGKVVVADIGIPPEAREGIVSDYILMDSALVFGRLKKRNRESHKGTYGKLLNLAGSQKYMGAAVLSSLAAMRSGAGYVTLASTKEVCRTVLPQLLETVMLPLKQNADGFISADSMAEILEAAEKSSAVLLGSGLGAGEDICQIVYALIQTAKCPLIIDADGINAISRNIDILRQANCIIVLTPHLMELSRLTAIPLELLKKDPLSAGLAFARDYHVTLVLKDAYTTTVTPEGKVYINTTGNAGLAKAGSGDVLAGIIGALTAQGYAPEDAAACGVWLHGKAGDYAAQVCSEYGMLARDVIDALTAVFRDHDR